MLSGLQQWKSVLVIDGPTVDPNFERASRNLKVFLSLHHAHIFQGDYLRTGLLTCMAQAIDYLPQRGINVYDVMRRDILVLSRQALVPSLSDPFCRLYLSL